MKKFRDWLRKFLGIDDDIKELKRSQDKSVDSLLNTIESNRKYILKRRDEIEELKSQIDDKDRKIQHLEKELFCYNSKLNKLNLTLKSVVNIGVDIDYYHKNEHSWAVVCIGGDMKVVKFMDLKRKDAREVMCILESFSCANHVVDSPPMYMFDDIFKFD